MSSSRKACLLGMKNGTFSSIPALRAQRTIRKRKWKKDCKSQRDCMIPVKSIFQTPQHWHTYEVTETLEAFIGPVQVQISLIYGPSRLTFHSSLNSFLGQFLIKQSIVFPWHLAIVPLGIYPRNLKSFTLIKTCGHIYHSYIHNF